MSMSISQIKKDQGSSKSRINNYDDQKTTAEVTGILKTLEEKNSKLSDDLKQDISRFRYYKVENKMVKRRTDIIIKKESNRRGSKTKRDSSSKKNSQIGVVTTGQPVPIPRIPTEKIQPGTQRSRQTINLSSLKDEKRDAKTDIFSKTAVEVHSSDQKKPKKLKRSGTGPINYISKNKQLGRVADVNKRRFSKLFCPNDEERERNIRIKTMKRDAHTARMGNREKIHFFMNSDKPETPGIGSYRNQSVREKKNLDIKQTNTLISKVNPEELYENIIKKDKPRTMQAKTSMTDANFTQGLGNFRNREQTRPMTRQEKALESEPSADISERNHKESKMSSLLIQSDEKGQMQYFTLFKKGLKKPTFEDENKKFKKKDLPPKKKRIVEKPIRSWRKENIHLETVMGKLLTSYAMMKPQEIDIRKGSQKMKGKIQTREAQRPGATHVKSQNLLLYNQKVPDEEYFDMQKKSEKSFRG
eukprot:CAMPEP_0197018392 /NCGR_PEP_ID=MMETSP1380-20130617/80073_1 /TAXON_ID=5936 /ORGANISM="Euplotes crassus, Strain CT5" /LENGTH=472 /DNA_ID=CAMNT_0042445603 /DNA_START=800 /DNA_END=2215 /DNA_ORIENTATION=-